LLAEQMVGDDAEAIIKKTIAMAKKGNEVALRLLVERILPAKKSIPIKFTLPQSLITARDIGAAMDAVVMQMASGELTGDEALSVSALLQSRLKVIETTDLEGRLAALEKTLQTTGNRT
jgi:hypothetical protein